MRWITCAVFIYFSVSAYERKSQTWVWIYAVLAGIYNPIVPAHLGRELWSLVNVVTVGLLALSFRKERIAVNGQ